MRLSLSSKKIIVNQMFLLKLCYKTQIYTIPKYVKKEIERGICDFVWNGKNKTSQAPSPTLYLDGWTRYFRHRHSIKLSKNKMNSKVIKSH